MTGEVYQAVGHVSELFRYPIKSVGGERLSSAQVNRRGLEGDRFWAVEDEEGKFGSGKSTRRFRQMDGLLEFCSYYRDDLPMLVLPDGSEVEATSPEATAALRQCTGKTVTVTAERHISHFDEGAIHLLTTSALSLLNELHGTTVDVRRLRNNITLDTGKYPRHLEADWIGKRLFIGDGLVLEIAYLMPRCVMVNLAQYNLPQDPQVLKTIAKMNPDVCIGVLAHVLQSGEIKLGDTAKLL